MDQVNVGDRIQIMRVSPDDDPQLLRKFGSVIMIIDSEKCFVILEEGGEAMVNINQVKKVQ